ncbi:MAG: hypothetical protein AAGI25_10970 [Bacteroidota bacterium]
MRNSFDPPLTLGCTPINEVRIPNKTRSHLAALAAALQHIYVNPQWKTRGLGLLSAHLKNGHEPVGNLRVGSGEVMHE